MDPTLAGFLSFLRASVAISTTVLPDNSDFIPLAFNYAENVTLSQLKEMPNVNATLPSIYATAVYNLATHILIETAQDQTGQTYFADARRAFGLNDAFGGLVNSASDQGTSASAVIPDWVQNMTLDEFSLIKTPYGRVYMRIAQKAHAHWGLS